MAAKKNITVNGTLTPVWQTDATAQEIDDAAEKSVWQSNPNLLDNWYFGNPVNQRGETSYSGAKYTIDRWRSTGGVVEITASDLELTADTSNRYIRQWLENSSVLMGKTLTLSAMDSNGDIHYATGMVPEVASTAQSSVCYTLFNNGGIYFQEDGSGRLFVQLRATSGLSQGYLAVKLELGDTQTLAHQDADGSWVLNEIPSYAEQLARCQRYLQVFEAPYDTAANYFTTGVAYNSVDFWVQIPLAVPMRTSPTVSVNDAGLLKVGKNYSSVVAATKVTGGWAIKSGDDCVMRSAIISASGLTAGENYNLFMANGAKLTLSAEL